MKRLKMLAAVTAVGVTISILAACGGAGDAVQDEEQIVGSFGPNLPFGIRNELDALVLVKVADVDSREWLTGDQIGRPDSSPPKGFQDILLFSNGDHRHAYFWPKAKSHAPFRLDFITDRTRGAAPSTSISFDTVFNCFSVLTLSRAPCSLLVKQDWQGWAWGSADRSSISAQIPEVCNTTSPVFTYTASNGQLRQARGRLECYSVSGGTLGHAIVLEDVK
ncbi:hypothetical protein [Paucibacter sp. Y2R2-4]|uniref:hypothetical protein n=1 Tax=Paucibacter sp. Y2R2-4 TaxID=2893553 RepID=UPI0021E39740|nr:hypothetical protein [Paucibacter sp. Y2R2-4]MCV2350577.1 hypothetical protein [Paucibacter sp. Y2R2-4]